MHEAYSTENWTGFHDNGAAGINVAAAASILARGRVWALVNRESL